MSEGDPNAAGIQLPGGTPRDGGQSAEISGEQMQEQAPRMWANKFKTPEDLEKGYINAEKALSKRADLASFTVDQLVEHSGNNAEELAVNWAENGRLTDEQYENFRKIGIGKDVVESFLRGQEAVARGNNYEIEQSVASAAKLAGGQDQLQNLFNWANNHYGEAELERLDGMVKDPRQIQAAVKEMMFDWKSKSGQGFTSELVNGQAMPNTASGFTSVAEFVEAMGKARANGFDPAFKRRLANTPKHIIQGVDR